MDNPVVKHNGRVVGEIVKTETDADGNPVAHIQINDAKLIQLMATDTPEFSLEDIHDHKPVQHRDDKEPWCETCKLNKNFEEPFDGLAHRRNKEI